MADVTQDMIDTWKKTFGEGNIRKATVCGIEFYYRPLMRAEFKLMANSGNPTATSFAQNMAMEEKSVVAATLFPPVRADGIDSLPAGAVTTLSELIMDASGFDQVVVPQVL